MDNAGETHASSQRASRVTSRACGWGGSTPERVGGLHARMNRFSQRAGRERHGGTRARGGAARRGPVATIGVECEGDRAWRIRKVRALADRAGDLRRLCLDHLEEDCLLTRELADDQPQPARPSRVRHSFHLAADGWQRAQGACSQPADRRALTDADTRRGPRTRARRAQPGCARRLCAARTNRMRDGRLRMPSPAPPS